MLTKVWQVPVSSSRMISSLKLVPPVVAMTFTPPRCLLSWILIWLTCRASSLVGTKTMAASTQRMEVRIVLMKETAFCERSVRSHAGRLRHSTLDVILFQIYSLQQRYEVSSTFSGAILGPSQNIPS